MPALAITLNQLAAALLGAGAYIYHAKQASQWKACANVCGCLIQRSSPDPYCAIAQVAQVLIDYEAQQAAQDLAVTPAARAAYKAAWAASEGQQVPARFAAAEAAAAASGDEQPHPADPAYLEFLEQEAAEGNEDEQPDPDEYDPNRCPHCGGAGVSHEQPDGCSGCNGSGQRRKGYWNNYGRDWDDSED